MRDRLVLSRRDLAALAVAVFAVPAATQAQTHDNGIGGTGAAPDPEEPEERPKDRGIGGTGVIGTIRRFGSIYVNGLHIEYPPDAKVTIDGAPSTTAALKIGHVVRVVADAGQDAYSTGAIAVFSEVVGPVQAATTGGLTVLGQAVSLEDLPHHQAWLVGQSVAVSGLRRNDGTIVASLIESRRPGHERVAGRLDRTEDGGTAIGDLRLSSVDPSLIGSRVSVRGRMIESALRVELVQTESSAIARMDVRRVVLEAYASRGERGLRLGSGLLVEDQGPPGQDATGLVILTLDVTKKGRLKVEGIQQASDETRSTLSSESRRSRSDRARGEGSNRGRGEGGRGRGGGNR